MRTTLSYTIVLHKLQIVKLGEDYWQGGKDLTFSNWTKKKRRPILRS